MDPNEIDSTPASLPIATRGVAPVWHTLVLVAAIVGVSVHGASQFSAAHAPIHRLPTYALTGAMELVMVGWILFGLRLRKTPIRSLLGPFSHNFRSIVIDLGFAMAFWMGSLMVLGTFAIAWVGVQALVTHRLPVTSAGQPTDPVQQPALHALTQLAPSNGLEIAAWVLLCLIAGFAEEFAFRGYLQRQFIAWSRGSVPAGVLLSALCFGSAHAYEGARGMFLITVFGVLFSLLALYRRTLRPGIIAHAWHDFIAGVALLFLKSSHII